MSSPSNVKTPPKVAVAQLPRIRRDRLEHRLHVALRLADHAQDLAGRGLLLEALPCSSLNSRVFSIAITAWSAKVLSSAI